MGFDVVACDACHLDRLWGLVAAGAVVALLIWIRKHW